MRSITETDSEAIRTINGIDAHKFRLFVSRIAEKIYSREEPFTREERLKLPSVLEVNSSTEMEAILLCVQKLFEETVYVVSKPKALAIELKRLGFNDEKIAIIVQLWTNIGSRIVERVKEDAFALTPKRLVDVNWKINVNSSIGSLSELNNIKSQLDLIFERNSGVAEEDKLSLELNHGELSAFYSQLECIQSKIDNLLK